MHPVFHGSLLTPYRKSAFPSQHRAAPPPPEIIGDEKEYHVESIVNSRRRKIRGRTIIDYKIRWEGYSAEHDQWITKSELPHCKELITEFHRKHPMAPKV